MSAAGALSSALALAELLGLGEEEAFAAAHLAEVESGPGWGTSRLCSTGVTFVEGGAPPARRGARIDGDFDMVLARCRPEHRDLDGALRPA